MVSRTIIVRLIFYLYTDRHIFYKRQIQAEGLFGIRTTLHQVKREEIL